MVPFQVVMIPTLLIVKHLTWSTRCRRWSCPTW